MRKIICTLFAIALLSAAGAPVAFAACHSRTCQDCPGQSAYCLDCGEFTDENQDGVCDHYDALCTECGAQKHDGTCGSRQKQSTVKESRHGSSRHHGGHHGRGHKNHR